jgi:class 3 adenylate cyclase/tetratricopeptide (TPR) repeat protein
MLCPNCNAENRSGAKFCVSCGHGLSLACPSCGAAYEPGDRFCAECGTVLDVPTGAAKADAPAAERRVVTVLFADLVGFTTISESRDAEEVRELLSRYFDTCRRLIGLYGGTVEKFIGDAVMAVWGAPVATEDDAERAVRAALDLVAAVSSLGDEIGAPELRARAGVLTGEAAVTLGAAGEGMVAGDLVNSASRVQALAEPGSVLVGDTTRRASEQTVVFEDAGEHGLKGKQETVHLWRALRVVSGVRGQLKSDGLEAPFVGRGRELRHVKDLFHASAEESKAQLVSVTGIAGIGKSRLAWEFYKYFDGIVETTWWHRGRCLAYGEGVTYWALADMVRMRCRIAEDEAPASAKQKLDATLDEHVLDESERAFVQPRLAQLLGLGELEAGDRQELYSAWRLFFERLADSNPTVLVFEDLQWADASLLDFIEYLLEWSRGHRIFVLTLARPELLEKRSSWGAGQRAFASIYLEPLAEAAMVELLQGLVPGLPDALRDQILARAEGVPLYAVETLRMLLDRGLLAREDAAYAVVGEVNTLAVPETLHALIAARLDGLSEQERRLLQDGAVLGKTFSAGALSALSGVGEPELQPLLTSLVRKEVLSLHQDPRSPEHGQYGFLQDLVRRVAYETLARKDRKARHLAAADHLTVTLGESEGAEVVAAHLLSAYEASPGAGDAEQLKARAARTLTRAGERAAGLAAAAEAQRYFEQAAALTDDARGQAELIDQAGRIAMVANKPVEARALLERARAAYVTLGDEIGAARVDSKLADIDFHEGHPPRAAARIAPALEALSRADPDDEAEASAQLGRFLIFTNDYDGAAPHIERALTLAEAFGFTETFVQALNSKGVLAGRRRRSREAIVLVNGALKTALEHDLHQAALRAYNNLAAMLWATDAWHEELESQVGAIELARRIGDRSWEATFLAGSIGAHMMLGRWDEAVEQARQAEAIVVTEFQRGLLVYSAGIHVHRGDLAEARRLLDLHRDVGNSENPDFSAGYLAITALLRTAEGRADEALAAMRGALGAHEATPPPWILYTVFDSARAIDEPETIRGLLTALDELHPGELTSLLRGQRARFRARLPEHDTEAELELAARVFAELGTPFSRAVVELELAEHLEAEGRIEDAATLRATAVETFEQLRAVPWLERARIDALIPR